VQGGVEAHAEQLCPALARLGCDVHVVVRKGHQPKEFSKQWRGVEFFSCWAPQTRGFEALVHSFLGVLYAMVVRPDILHIHAIGPALMAPLARICGLTVVVTHHGQDYQREKWGRLAKIVLKAGEKFGVKYANHCIVVSRHLHKLITHKYKTSPTYIPNGVSRPAHAGASTILADLCIKPGRYVLTVSRLVPEKRQLDLIEAFKKSGLRDWKLVIVGAIDRNDPYCENVVNAAARVPNTVLAGFQSGPALQQLYTNAGVFVLPSSHEGLPIAMLEAIGYCLRIIASDIPAHLEIEDGAIEYFRLGDLNELAERLRVAATLPSSLAQPITARPVLEQYNWDRIAKQTFDVYLNLSKGKFTKSVLGKTGIGASTDF